MIEVGPARKKKPTTQDFVYDGEVFELTYQEKTEMDFLSALEKAKKVSEAKELVINRRKVLINRSRARNRQREINDAMRDYQDVIRLR